MATKKFTGVDMLYWWDLYRDGKRKSEIMRLMDLTEEQCTKLGDEACKKFGRGPRKPRKPREFKSRVPVFIEEKKKTFTRPPAKYDNMQPVDYEKKYLGNGINN